MLQHEGKLTCLVIKPNTSIFVPRIVNHYTESNQRTNNTSIVLATMDLDILSPYPTRSIYYCSIRLLSRSERACSRHADGAFVFGIMLCRLSTSKWLQRRQGDRSNRRQTKHNVDTMFCYKIPPPAWYGHILYFFGAKDGMLDVFFIYIWNGRWYF
jgi:hypothetical protein